MSDLDGKKTDSRVNGADFGVKKTDAGVRKIDGLVIKTTESQEYDKAVRNAVGSLSLTLLNLDGHAESIAESLEILAEYHLRKGRQEGLFAPDEYLVESGEEDGDGDVLV